MLLMLICGIALTSIAVYLVSMAVNKITSIPPTVRRVIRRGALACIIVSIVLFNMLQFGAVK